MLLFQQMYAILLRVCVNELQKRKNCAFVYAKEFLPAFSFESHEPAVQQPLHVVGNRRLVIPQLSRQVVNALRPSR